MKNHSVLRNKVYGADGRRYRGADTQPLNPCKGFCEMIGLKNRGRHPYQDGWCYCRRCEVYYDIRNRTCYCCGLPMRFKSRRM